MNDEVKETNEEETKEDFVSKKAYQEVTTDMHKYKQELQATKAKLTEIEAIQVAKEQEALEEQGKWEELYKQSQEKLSSIASERDSEKKQFIDYHKKNSVLQKVGGFKRDDYNKFINVENVKVNEDGSINGESLESEVDRIRQEYPELLKTVSSTKLPTDAPAQSEVGNKSYSQLSEDEKNTLKRSLLQKPEGY